ncbi:MAG TPA: hypothetical protein VNO17_00685, partial [Actinomycetota bacterium]|nr:hypothetical protein [Actinomycetota bacterium]
MDTTTLLLILVPFLAFVLVSLAAFSFMSRQVEAASRRMERAGRWEEDEDDVVFERPWWGNPGVWLLVSAVFVALGLFVFPQLFG